MVRMLDQKILRTQYKHAKDRLFLFDYDGTLTPIVSNPAAAIPNDETIHTLKSLAQNPKNVVWIISGRDQQFLEKYFRGIAEIGLSAEHGCFMRPPRCGSWKNLTDSSNLGWQKEVMETYQRFVDTTPGSNIEQKKVALTWHYRGADPAVGKSQAERCRKSLQEGVLKKYNVEVIAGKANLEVRPRFVNKGYMTSQLADEFSSKNGHPPGFVLCAGDDFTDEDMFGALHQGNIPASHVFTIAVGASHRKTLAHWHLEEPSDVIGALTGLIAADGDQPS